MGCAYWRGTPCQVAQACFPRGDGGPSPGIAILSPPGDHGETINWRGVPHISAQSQKLFALAESHLDDDDREVRNMATALFIHFERLFTFLEYEGVEPTNNVAERTLRTAVQWRKISFGNRSRDGEIATARSLTVTQTCKRQQRQVLGYLTDAVRCHRCQADAPSLLPRP